MASLILRDKSRSLIRKPNQPLFNSLRSYSLFSSNNDNGNDTQLPISSSNVANPNPERIPGMLFAKLREGLWGIRDNIGVFSKDKTNNKIEKVESANDIQLSMDDNVKSKAEKAFDVLNFTPLNEKPIRIIDSHRDSSVRKSGTGKVFIKNLDNSVDNKGLHDVFTSFGKVLSCQLATDSNGQSKGYGYVQFDSEDAARESIKKLNRMLINDKQVIVEHFVRKQERDVVSSGTKFTNVYVKNLSESTDDRDLERIFGEYGKITSAVVMRDSDGKSRCFGFVNFDSPDNATRAIDALNGRNFDEKEWCVRKAQKKTEREQELKGKFQGANLYIKNLDDTIDDEKLKELFTEHGNVTSCKVMRNPSGISKGSGFVVFSTPDEASRALAEMNGKFIVSKPLYVAVAEKRRSKSSLAGTFFSKRPMAMAPSVPRRMPNPPGAPGLAQQFSMGQGPPMMPPQDKHSR